MKCLRCGAENNQNNYCSTCGGLLQNVDVSQNNISGNNIINGNINNQMHESINLNGVQNQGGSNNVNQSSFINSDINNTTGNQQVPNYSMNTNAVNQQVPNYNNLPNSSNNSKNNPIIIIIAVVVIAALVGLGMFLWKQYKLKQVDKELQEQVGNIGTIDPIGGNNNQNNNDKTTYKVGDAVSLLDGSKWHVIGISGNNVTLLSDTLAKEKSGYGDDASAKSQQYENSAIKKYLESTYLPTLKNSLQSKGGNISNLKVRLLTIDEFIYLTNARWVTSSNGLKLSTYSVYKSDAGDNFKWLSMTSNFWLKDYIVDEKNNGFFYGAYYVEVNVNENEYFSTMQIETDLCGDKSTSNKCGNYFGIRPVIETDSSNIKK